MSFLHLIYILVVALSAAVRLFLLRRLPGSVCHLEKSLSTYPQTVGAMNRDKSERKDVGKLTGEEIAKRNTKDDLGGFRRAMYSLKESADVRQ